MKARPGELMIRLTTYMALTTRRHLDTATEQAMTEARARGDYRKQDNIVITGFKRRVTDVGVGRWDPKSVALTFSFAPRYYGPSKGRQFGPFEALVLKRAFEINLRTGMHTSAAKADAITARVKAIDAWLDLPIVDRIAGLDRTRLVVA